MENKWVGTGGATMMAVTTKVATEDAFETADRPIMGDPRS